ncbi:hypothetical protein DVH24_029747 [Malus domestica]|uniref:Uncharacterized protein n=1 Tax=Malus domestica TaxID=3750 RepID=A0A498HU99_MALDO|nr:hypothetical protein DVH24_029747 [Malus domestica]
MGSIPGVVLPKFADPSYENSELGISTNTWTAPLSEQDCNPIQENPKDCSLGFLGFLSRRYPSRSREDLRTQLNGIAGAGSNGRGNRFSLRRSDRPSRGNRFSSRSWRSSDSMSLPGKSFSSSPICSNSKPQ